MRTVLTALLVIGAAGALRADEGMWTFDNVPVQAIKAKYGFTPDQAFLDHLRLASVNFGGASASFVSADGLVITNHHVGRGSVQMVSDKDHDYIRDGFAALTRDQEKPIPGLELKTLLAMDDVTARVNAAVLPGMSDQAARKAREEAMERIKAEFQKASGRTCEGVVLYQGGEYWIYTYQKHTDVRLVLAPELGIAAFGGDYDNFTYPRHNLDFSIFRVYENGKPYHPKHFLNVSRTGVKTGELTFVTGHPASTSRLETYAQMCAGRDVVIPARVAGLERLKASVLQYAAGSPEQRRQVNTLIFGLENSIKAYNGFWAGLKNPENLARVGKLEAAFQAQVQADPALKARAGESWARIETALKAQAGMVKEQAVASALVAPRHLPTLASAVTLTRFAVEEAKPSEARLPEFSAADLKNTRDRLLVARPANNELEIHLLAFTLRDAREQLGASHPLVQTLLGDQEPQAMARALVTGSRLQDPAVRKALLDGGAKAVAASSDPMLVLARKLDPMLRDLRRQREDQVASVLAEHGGRIAQARFRLSGRNAYPDATRTLRFSYGTVAGYAGNGTMIQPFTTFLGLYDRAVAWGPEAGNGAWALPKRWLEARGRLDLDMPFNFVHTVDTTGGNSGSPITNVKGELVGLLFDGNIESLAGDYFYDERSNRSVSVDMRAVLESLAKVYGAQVLVKEMLP